MNKTQNKAAQESMPLGNLAKHISNICFDIKAGHTMDVSGHSICRTVSNSTCSNDSNFQKYIWQKKMHLEKQIEGLIAQLEKFKSIL